MLLSLIARRWVGRQSLGWSRYVRFSWSWPAAWSIGTEFLIICFKFLVMLLEATWIFRCHNMMFLSITRLYFINPLVTNGLSHHYHLDESTFILGEARVIFNFYCIFRWNSGNLAANRIAPDGTPRSSASHLGLFCLLLSYKKDARLIWVKVLNLYLFVYRDDSLMSSRVTIRTEFLINKFF